MKNIVLYDEKEVRDNLLPLTYTRPVSLLRVGINTISEKWLRAFGGDATISYITPEYLQSKFPAKVTGDNIFIASHTLPTAELVEHINDLNLGEALCYNNEADGKKSVIAFRCSKDDYRKGNITPSVVLPQPPEQINMLYDIFLKNGEQLTIDFRAITAGRQSQQLSPSNVVIGNPTFDDGTAKIFIEEGAWVEGTYLNVTNGPIYIGCNAEVMEGSCIRAPFAACDNAHVNMGTKIYGATTLGPYCKVGGELNNVVMIGYSNKAHDGFLGNAVIGEWTNIGAGTSASNLKNDYTEIKLWNYPTTRFLRTGLQFCGLIMGDHTKVGVNCMLNTATVLGVGVNIHGSGFPRAFVPSFSEGSTAGFTDVSLVKFFQIAERVMARRGKKLTDDDRNIFTHIYNQADSYK
ncbi:MAG: putative sugar nucleotidyl transferase [Muribaculaceae bacterium]